LTIYDWRPSPRRICDIASGKGGPAGKRRVNILAQAGQVLGLENSAGSGRIKE
jgi:hypothetical protein